MLAGLVLPVAALKTYLKGVSQIHAVGEAVEETSYYGQIEMVTSTP